LATCGGQTLETFTKILFVAVGGAFGAAARYLINVSPLSRVFEHFPLPTLVVNTAGSFLLGFLLILLTDRLAVSDNLRMMVIVGFLGAFTTFSTFEMEIYGLMKERLFSTALLYLMLSVVAGFLGLVAGVSLAQSGSFRK
jgi:fluoride exporter